MKLFVYSKILRDFCVIEENDHFHFCDEFSFLFYQAVVKEKGFFENDFYIISDKKVNQDYYRSNPKHKNEEE